MGPLGARCFSALLIDVRHHQRDVGCQPTAGCESVSTPRNEQTRYRADRHCEMCTCLIDFDELRPAVQLGGRMRNTCNRRVGEMERQNEKKAVNTQRMQ